MTKIIWDESLSVGNDKLDHQHQELIRLNNILHDSLTSGPPETMQLTKLDVLRSLCQYARYHFTAEETYLQEIDYPEIAEHRAQHRYFTEKVDNMLDQATHGEIILSTSMIKFLRNWIRDHISTMDARYRRFADHG